VSASNQALLGTLGAISGLQSLWPLAPTPESYVVRGPGDERLAQAREAVEALLRS
jgi:hypothetical protein